MVRSRDDHGEVMGVAESLSWKMEASLNTIIVSGGSYLIGAVDQDVVSIINVPKQIAVSSLYVDKYQVTNRQVP